MDKKPDPRARLLRPSPNYRKYCLTDLTGKDEELYSFKVGKDPEGNEVVMSVACVRKGGTTGIASRFTAREVVAMAMAAFSEIMESYRRLDDERRLYIKDRKPLSDESREVVLSAKRRAWREITEMQWERRQELVSQWMALVMMGVLHPFGGRIFPGKAMNIQRLDKWCNEMFAHIEDIVRDVKKQSDTLEDRIDARLSYIIGEALDKRMTAGQIKGAKTASRQPKKTQVGRQYDVPVRSAAEMGLLPEEVEDAS